MFTRLLSSESECRCEPTFEADRLSVGGDDCPGGGRLTTESACRRTVIEALERRDVDSVCTRSDGFERAYEGRSAALLVAAGRFADAAGFHDEALADRAREDPLGAAQAAAGRNGAVSNLVAETGLGVFLGSDYPTALRPHVGPTVAKSRVATRPAADATLQDRYELETGAIVRWYESDEGTMYHLTPAVSAGSSRYGDPRRRPRAIGPRRNRWGRARRLARSSIDRHRGAAGWRPGGRAGKTHAWARRPRRLLRGCGRDRRVRDRARG
ncbi:MAG: hypothetical protein RI560_04185 [Natronomonas sp.]|nr:hypothetical protein [Natronomonas sp.]